MDEILKMLNALSADELDRVIMRATIMLEKKRKEEAERARLEEERQRQERIEQERRRQEEIAALQRKLKELQSQRVSVPEDPDEVRGDNFVMRESGSGKDSASRPAAQPASAQSANMISCPYCHQMNAADSQFCSNCGQRIVRQSQPAAQPQPVPRPAPQPQPVPQPRGNSSQVRFADESMKEWQMLPGETSVRPRHEIQILQPKLGRKFAYYMEVTDKRILLTRESAAAANAGVAFGLAGALVKELAHAGPKPWLEVPLSAITNCGLLNKKEFFIEADQTYVFKNKGYEKYLPGLIANAKR